MVMIEGVTVRTQAYVCAALHIFHGGELQLW